MKPLFLFLVLLNLAYMGWRAWIVPTQAPPALVEAEGVPRLVMIGEDPNDPAFQMPEVLPQDEGTTEPSTETAKPARDPASDPARDEVAELPAEPETPTDIPAEVDVAVAPAELRCVSLGPFLNLREATEATAMLIETGLEPSQRLSESQVWFGHWVHLPPLPSRDAAVAIVDDLRSKGVNDIYIEPSGALRNAISLGVFSEREHAETLAGRIRKLGISPQIRDRYRDSSVYWVDFAMPEGQVIDPSEYRASPNRVLRIEGRNCPEEG
ncbi:MAG: hypothetical protein OEQ74_11475 [Gammaproteobacteria bacterium]|nr:hypothetical protein [Gammaproteobacteria bacterium]